MTKQKYLRCLTCRQPLPADQDYPKYFAQSGRTPSLDDIYLLLDYAQGLFDALYQLTLVSRDAPLHDDEDEATRTLARLGFEIIAEIERRVGIDWEEEEQ